MNVNVIEFSVIHWKIIRSWREGNVFNYFCLSVSHSIYREVGRHVTIIHNVLDLTVQGPSLYKAQTLPSPPPVQGSSPLLVTSVGQDWKPVKLVHLRTSLYSSHPLPPRLVLTSGECLLKHIRWVSGRYAFYWNAFLFVLFLHWWRDLNC